MRHRIFIAINLSEKMKQRLAQFQKKWPTLPCRWVSKENLHLTLAFLGYLNDEQLNVVFEIAKEVAERNKPFKISLDKICYGPPKTMPPRLVWAEGESFRELSKLKEDLDKLLAEKINFSPEKREFTPHITLGRIKRWNWRRFEPEERPDVNLEVSLEIPVNSIEVMESHLKRTGAEYTILESFELKSDGL